jgi:acetolactate synthase I/II/III large subunit
VFETGNQALTAGASFYYEGTYGSQTESYPMGLEVLRMRVYDAIVRVLESVGVDVAFGGAGENAAFMMLALKHSKIKPVIVRNEQAASFMACGYGIYSGRLGFCWATAGPGAFNLFSGLAVAMSDSYPVLAISGFASLDWKGKGALNETSGVSRTPDSQKMFTATTKGSWLLDDPAKTCDVMEEALNLAFERRPGPVHIHVPENLTKHGMLVDNYRKIKINIRPVLPDDRQIASAADVLANAIREKKKVIGLFGYGAVRSNANIEMRALSKDFRSPLSRRSTAKGLSRKITLWRWESSPTVVTPVPQRRFFGPMWFWR